MNLKVTIVSTLDKDSSYIVAFVSVVLQSAMF